MRTTKNPNQIFTCIYCIWLFTNLFFLFNSVNYSGDKEILYPFYGDEDPKYNSFYEVYDLSEFVLYGLSPLVIWIVYNNLFDKK